MSCCSFVRTPAYLCQFGAAVVVDELAVRDAMRAPREEHRGAAVLDKLRVGEVECVLCLAVGKDSGACDRGNIPREAAAGDDGRASRLDEQRAARFRRVVRKDARRGF